MTTLTLETAPYLDLADPGFSVRSPEVRAAREHSWFARTDYGIAVLRYDEVRALFKHPKLRVGTHAWPALNGIIDGPYQRWFQSWILNKEGEDHQRLRRLLRPAFSPTLMRSLVPRFQEVALELADGFALRGECEFMSEFAEPYAARLTAILLGLPDEEWPMIVREANALSLAMTVTIKQDLPKIEAALQTLYDYADQLIEDRRARPLDDFVTALAQTEQEDGGLSADELRDTIVLMVQAGFDTTKNQLGLAMQTFLEHPDQWRLLAERPELCGQAIDEVMRVNPMVRWNYREALETFEFEGLEIIAGTMLLPFTESAGSDPLVVGESGFDITAERKPQFGFGGGAHYCMGQFVARTDMSLALSLLAQRMPDLRPAGPATMRPDSANTGPITLPGHSAPSPA